MPSPAETYGHVLIEATSAVVPIVASGGGGVPDIIHHGVNGLLVSPGDAKGMGDALKTYANSPELRRKMSQQGLKEAREKYEFRVVERKLYDLLGLQG